LFDAPEAEGSDAAHMSDPQTDIDRSRVFARLQLLLGAQTVDALSQARDAREWTALFLSSPEFMYR
jgi:hypothetical protein